MTRLAWAALLAAVVAASAGLARAEGPLDAEARQAAVTQLAEAIRQRYVYPDIGAKLADVITTRQKTGAYDGLTDPAQFALRLKADLDAVARDKHLNLEAPNSPPPADLPPPPPLNEAGVVRAGKLNGEIGYIEVVGFPPFPQFRPVIDRAMAPLAGSKAIILDVRRNYGGSPGSVAYLVSFLVPQSTHINDIVTRTPNTTEFTREVFNAQPTPVNFAGRPIIVLTSRLTFSGGEELAYDLQSLKAATIIGETTGGGANPTERVDLTSKLTAFIPRGRAENPVTKSNWEGTGVTPDVAAAAPDALNLALARLGQPPVANIEAAPQMQLFKPRSTPLPQSEAAIKRLLAWIAGDVADDATIAPEAVERFRQEAPGMRERIMPLGALKATKFVRVDPQGGDEYRLTFANGVRGLGVILTPDGKILAWNWIGAPGGS